MNTETITRPPRTGKEAFEQMPQGTLCQLINDAIIMSPAPNTPHADIQNEIFNCLYSFVKRKKLGKTYCAPVDVYLDSKNIYQPDILFIAEARVDIIKTRGIFGAPDLVIEILSEDRIYDLVTKKKVYEQSGVKEYWVVDPVTKWCEGFYLDSGKFISFGEYNSQFTVRMFDLKISF